MKLILIPLTILVVLSICSMLGLGNTTLGDATYSVNLNNAYYYDEDGNAKVYVANLTCVTGEQIKIVKLVQKAWFTNATSTYLLYYDQTATNSVDYEDLGKLYNEGLDDIDLSSSIGMITIVIAVMAIAAIVGLRVLGSGVSETSVSTILSGTALMIIWGVFSVLGMELILEMELLGPILYFALTILYTLGIIMKIGGSDE